MRSDFKFAAAVCGFLSLPSFGRAVNISRNESSSCRVLPGDNDWPSLEQWSQLNATVDGRLIATVPLGSPCHDPTYNETECAYLTDNWSWPQIYFNSSAQIMLPYFQNHTCDPFTPETSACTIGNLAEYSIEVTSAEDVVAGLNFAQDNNVRLVIKNTGHDFLGKSTGKGALGLWTHHLKDIEFLDYSSANYSGPAIKMGAGVQAWEAYEAASANGLRVVGGTCPTVGLAGGYSQGGGHSSLSSIYGLGADQTLEWEVVTADGQHLIATPTQNADLYWALSGGGPGTYAVVLSLTSKAHVDGPVGGASIYFTSDGISEDTYWEAIGNWQPLITELGLSGATSIITVTSDYFNLAPYTIVNTTVDEVKAQLAPFTTALDSLNISYVYNVTNSPGFLEHFSTYLGPLPYGQYGIAETIGSRLIPRTVVENNNTAITAVLRDWVDKGFIINGLAQHVPHSVANNTASSNAVLPAWRDSAIHMIASSLWNWTAPWSSNVANADTITNDLIPQLEALTPGSGTYLNEGDFQLATWKEDFFGSNYDQLRAVKKKYDANDLFYVLKGVGSDAWTVASDGRLCRA